MSSSSAQHVSAKRGGIKFEHLSTDVGVGILEVDVMKELGEVRE